MRDPGSRTRVVLSGGEASVLIGLLEAAEPKLSRELRAVAREYGQRLDDQTTQRVTGAAAARSRSASAAQAYEELRDAYLRLQKRVEAAMETARTVKRENAALRGVIRKAATLIGTTGPVKDIAAGDELLVSLRTDLHRYAA